MGDPAVGMDDHGLLMMRSADALTHRVAAMPEDRMNLLARREIIAAYVAVSARLDEFIRICTTVPGERHEVRAAVQDAFGLTEIPAEAVLSMQMRRLSPSERQRTKDELDALDAHIQRAESSARR